MGFFNSLSIRIPLAIIGGILYGALTYSIVVLLVLSSELAISAAIVVFLFYLGSRLLILFSGINSPYYSKMKRGVPNPPIETNSFHQTTQWSENSTTIMIGPSSSFWLSYPLPFSSP
jgi:hypothetical protein